MRGTRSIVVTVLLAVSFSAWTSAEVRGERVGYSFEGKFIQPGFPSGGTIPIDNNVFGLHFPFDAPFNGTFSYDTNSNGVIPFPDDANTKDFKQFIQGGFTFDVFSTDGGPRIFQLVANVYAVRVSNDYTPSGAPVASDLLSVEFNTLWDPSLPPILKNGLPYKKNTLITVPVSWDWTTFDDPDEPKLRSELPQTYFKFQGTMAAQGVASFEINSIWRIPKSAGDYNFDAKVDGSDYFEWRKAFGQTSPDFSYADGNGDGIVDAADYVIWRSATGLSASGTSSLLVPEPSATALIAVGPSILAYYKRRRFLCH